MDAGDLLPPRSHHQSRTSSRFRFSLSLLNPKAYLFYIAVLPRFVDPGRPLASQTITLSLIYVAIATAIHTAMAVLGGTAEPFASGGRGRTIGRALSLALAAAAVWLAFATAR